MTRTNPHAPIPGQPAVLVVDELTGDYLARYPLDVAGEAEAYKAARDFMLTCSQFVEPTLKAYDGKSDKTLAQAAQAVIDAFGGDWPDWLKGELADLESALEREG